MRYLVIALAGMVGLAMIAMGTIIVACILYVFAAMLGV